MLALALAPKAKHWITVVFALVARQRQMLWEGLDVRVGPQYVLLRTSDRLRVLQLRFVDDPDRSRGDLVFWRGSAAGSATFATQKDQCRETWTDCGVFADSSASPRWECIRSAKYGNDGPQVVRCLMGERGISALYRCVGQACADFGEVVRRSFESFRQPTGVTDHTLGS
jgi:hypothetical protein